MATTIVRGSTCRISFTPLGGLDVTQLGTPAIAISQELTLLTPEVVVDAENNRIYSDLKEEDTIQLVEGVETRAQAMFADEGGQSVYRFPVHPITVESTLVAELLVNEEEEEEEEELPSLYIYAKVDTEQDDVTLFNPYDLGWMEKDSETGVYERSLDVYFDSTKTYYIPILIEDNRPAPSEQQYLEYDSERNGYVLTQDVDYVPGKTYYEATEMELEDGDDPSALGLYVHDSEADIYVLTEDTEGDPLTVYYSISPLEV